MSVWEAVVGQTHAVGLLEHDVRSERVAHAYLFTGAAGRAPLDAAVALAAACICPDAGCGRCTACGQVSRLAHPDVEVVEPAGTQLLVDQVREVIKAAWRSPSAAPRRLIVVDQADRMNPNAQNAFLKALEEPPASTVIVLVAPSAETLLDTVRSRCREVAFHPLPEAAVAAELERDGVSASDARVWARAGGSLERARRLAADPGARERRRELAERLLQTARDPGDALETAEWLTAQTRSIRDEVAEAHRRDLEEHADWYKETKRAAEDRLRREQRRAEQDSLEGSLEDVLSIFRDLLALIVDPEAGLLPGSGLLNEDLRTVLAARATELGAASVAAVLACLSEVDETRRRLRANANVLLALERLFLAVHERLG